MGRPPPTSSSAEGAGEAAAHRGGTAGGGRVTGGGVVRHSEVVVEDCTVDKLLLVGYRWREGRGGEEMKGESARGQWLEWTQITAQLAQSTW